MMNSHAIAALRVAGFTVAMPLMLSV